MNREQEERDWREEADELGKLPVPVQVAHIQTLEKLAVDPDAKKSWRTQNRRRVAALRKFLGLEVKEAKE